jgi:hypothetical protein
MAPCYEAKSLEGFIQQLAVGFVSRGYCYYVTGWIPKKKDPCATDEKIIWQYGIGLTKSSRMRRKEAGYANVQYLRLGRFFVIVASLGIHPFFENEGELVRDMHRPPFFTFGGYSIKRCYSNKQRRWRTSVRIDQETYRDLKVKFLNAALRVDELTLAERIRALPFEPYKPIRSQIRSLWRAVNRARHTAGLELVPKSCLRAKRHLLRPYEDHEPSWLDGDSGPIQNEASTHTAGEDIQGVELSGSKIPSAPAEEMCEASEDLTEKQPASALERERAA